MADIKKNFNRTKVHLNIGTIGHVDAGKTTTAAAITRVQSKLNLAKFVDYGAIDKAPEEKKRGITISATHVQFETDSRHYALIDCPGHADYIKNMITGAAQMDGAIVIVSSSGGVEKQTQEHLLLAKQIGIKSVVVLINDKTDSGLNEETRELLEMDIRDALRLYGYDTDNDETPIVFASSLKALNGDPKEEEKISFLIKKLDEHIEVPLRDENKPFLLYIEDMYSIKGQGTVVTGKVLQGKAKEGDKLEIVGLGMKKEVTVKGIEMFHQKLDETKPGDDVGLNLRGIERIDVRKGQALGVGINEYSEFEAHAYILSEKERGRSTSFKSGYRPQFFIYTADITGEIILPDGSDVQPGKDIDKFIVKLVSPMVIRENDHFIMREGGKTVGQGIITKIIK